MNRFRRQDAVVAAALIFAVGCAGAAEVVSVKPGDDLAAVRDRVRAWRGQNAARKTQRVTIELQAGRYERSQPLELGPDDSFVTWRAANGAEVRVSGGQLVSTPPCPVTDAAILAQLPENAREHVVQYDLDQLGIADWGSYLYNSEDAVQRRVANTWGQGEFTMGSHPVPKDMPTAGRMELFVDDRPLVVARSRKGVVYHIETLTGPTIQAKGREFGRSAVGAFIAQENVPAAWAGEPDPFVCGCWCHDWAEQHQRIEKFDPATRAFELSKPYHQYHYAKGAYFFGVNMLCELDEPGEWYIHRGTRKLIVWMPPSKEARPRVELSRASRLFELTGAKGVAFEGLTLEACRNSAVRMKDCSGCVLASCTVRNVGQHALIVEDGTSCGARRCAFYGMGGGGAWLVDDNRKSLVPSGHFVEDCDIHDFGRWNRMYRPGVCLSGVGMRVVRTRIHDAPHAAVLYFGCDHLMQSNEISRVCAGSKDCGAFYSGRSWLLRGNRILDNFFHDIVGLDGNMTRTIYLDDSMAEVKVVGNRFERCTWSLFIGGSRENVITNNVFIDCPGAIYVDKRGMGWQHPHIDGRLKEMSGKGTLYGLPFRTGVYAERYPAVRNLPGGHPYEPVLNVIAHNRFIRGKAEWIAKYAPAKLKDSPRWWRSGEVTDEELSRWGVFEDNVVDNAGLAETSLK